MKKTFIPSITSRLKKDMCRENIFFLKRNFLPKDAYCPEVVDACTGLSKRLFQNCRFGLCRRVSLKLFRVHMRRSRERENRRVFTGGMGRGNLCSMTKNHQKVDCVEHKGLDVSERSLPSSIVPNLRESSPVIHQIHCTVSVTRPIT